MCWHAAEGFLLRPGGSIARIILPQRRRFQWFPVLRPEEAAMAARPMPMRRATSRRGRPKLRATSDMPPEILPTTSETGRRRQHKARKNVRRHPAAWLTATLGAGALLGWVIG